MALSAAVKYLLNKGHIKAGSIDLGTELETIETAASAAQADATQGVADAAAAQADATQAISDAAAAQADATQAIADAAAAQADADVGVDFRVRLLKAQYDFGTMGGAQGDINLKDVNGANATLPDNAVVSHVLIDVITPATSLGAATVAIKSEGAADLLGATAVASVTGMIDGIPDNTAANVVKMTAARVVKATIATADLTAGKFNVFIQYVLSD